MLGGTQFVAPSDKVNVALIGAGGQGRTNARALFQEEDCQVIALADPAEEWDLSTWYYGGKSGRGPVKAEVENHYAGKTPNHTCAVYEDFRVMSPSNNQAVRSAPARSATPIANVTVVDIPCAKSRGPGAIPSGGMPRGRATR